MDAQQASRHLLVFGVSVAIETAIGCAAKQRGWRVAGVARHWSQQPETLSFDLLAAESAPDVLAGDAILNGTERMDANYLAYFADAAAKVFRYIPV